MFYVVFLRISDRKEEKDIVHKLLFLIRVKICIKLASSIYKPIGLSYSIVFKFLLAREAKRGIRKEKSEIN